MRISSLSIRSYECRFRVVKGVDGSTVVPEDIDLPMVAENLDFLSRTRNIAPCLFETKKWGYETVSMLLVFELMEPWILSFSRASTYGINSLQRVCDVHRVERKTRVGKCI